VSKTEAEERPFGGFSGSEGYDGPLEDGRMYPATLVGLKERHVEQGQWPGWKVIWTFAIEGRERTIEQEAMTSGATGPDSTAGPWIRALVGEARYEERTTQIIPPDELIGRECSIFIRFNDNGWPRVKDVVPRAKRGEPDPPPPPMSQASDFDDLPF
jgi:hypothetical protein